MTDRIGLSNNAQRLYDLRRELRHHKDLLEDVLNFIRHEDRKVVIQAIAAIRSSDSTELSIVSPSSERLEHTDQNRKTET
ncbi:hypothetical protein BJX63DRAFT_76479 [Aspergillus granulosus]|uniref:Uncharacterized protein n=1 Tax=Aspergillus granulosus TaxID=176169 RepID=A0ABR4GW99_9EURO